MIEPGTIVDGRYRVVSRIGSGGMADVYLAQDQLLGRDVAVKLLHHHFAEDHEFVERFKREASSAAALSHPNIVGIFDRGEWNGTYYIAMEYVHGRSLKQIVREEGALDPASAIDIVVQIARAARFAHRRGVIHRDLKPQNVILDEEGRARVTDFGIARAGASDMTLTGSIMGTAQYLSPEQAQGFPVSDASDLYSIGVILYELLTGVVPFEGDSAVAIAFKQVSAVPRPPSELNPALPVALDAIVLRALAKDPAQRYASADELIAALQHEREALPAFSGAALAGALPAGATLVAAQPPPPPPPMFLGSPSYPEPDGHPPAQERSRGRRAFVWAALGLLLAAAAIALVIVLTGSHEMVRVPNVAGDNEQDASAALRRVGLDPVPSLEASTTVPTGLVVGERPAAGQSVRKGSRVDVVLSSGPAIKGLPDVNGLSSSEGVSKLKKEGFKPTVKSQSSATVPSGKVIATEPSAGTGTVQGTSVTVLVSSGPAPVSVPDLRGDSLAAAEAALAGAGLALGTVGKKPSSAATGTVISQSPASGSSVRAGAKVNLTLAQAPKEKPVIVPTVVGLGQIEAEEALERKELEPQITSVATSEIAQLGKVTRQSPSGGSRARKHTVVHLFVASSSGGSTTPTGTTTTGTTTTTSSLPGSPATP